MATSSSSATHARLLEGAARVFAERGLLGATTKEIALTAGVNEATLFRHFQSKQRLLAAVIEHVFVDPEELPAAAKEADLREMLRAFAERYARRMGRNMALVRVLVGEIQHCDEQEVCIMREVFRPRRQELIASLTRARKAGRVRRNAVPAIAADQFGAMIFTALLKRSLPGTPEYTFERYLAECVESMARALETRAAG